MGVVLLTSVAPERCLYLNGSTEGVVVTAMFVGDVDYRTSWINRSDQLD